jgi:NADPH-ferrihemoprotein reductase
LASQNAYTVQIRANLRDFGVKTFALCEHLLWTAQQSLSQRKSPRPIHTQNPYKACISKSQRLFQGGERDYLHVEFDLGRSNLVYETGDHLAVWPANSDVEVERFLRVFGLVEKRNRVIDIPTRDQTVKVTIPAPTTYEAAARHYLEICGPVSRDLLGLLALFPVAQEAKSKLIRLANSATAFQNQVRFGQLNLSQLLESLDRSTSFSQIPFSFLLENLSKLKPRYYSISISSLASKKSVSITAVVESKRIPGFKHQIKGVATNYLQALSQPLTGGLSTEQPAIEPVQKASQPTALVHVRSSKFRLPKDSSVPIIILGPGTGVAPFRAFLQERARRSRDGKAVGRTMLFYGCRNRNEDFLYADV